MPITVDMFVSMFVCMFVHDSMSKLILCIPFPLSIGAHATREPVRGFFVARVTRVHAEGGWGEDILHIGQRGVAHADAGKRETSLV